MMTESRFTDDPTATYRGYRRQALYCLFRLFDDCLPHNCIVQPEGHEDLAIYKENGDLIEIVQVKDYSDNLTASTFKASFYKRISQFCAQDSTVGVTIASFGNVGPELAKALDNAQETPQRALDTLTKDREVVDADGNKTTISGVSLDEAKDIFAHVVLDEVDEDTLTARVLEQLRATMTSGDPLRAFENLMWWLIASAEKRSKLTRAQTIQKITQLGQFLTHRAAYEHEWNISIKPIQSPSVDQLDDDKLKREFFQGGRVRIAHVAASLDIPRIEALHEIHTSFQQERVVILRAASGQGKTTLAYRYLLDWVPTHFRYEVLQAAAFQHARRMSAAIAGHVEAIDVPTIVYVDVRPGDSLWMEFVRELAAVPDVRVLVTIREEDWFRSRVTRDDFNFIDLSVAFTEETACEIFRALRANGFGNTQLDFNDAWAQLGDRKTLFEFVYLTTQNERLTEKIKVQIVSLKDQVNDGTLTDKELQLLRLVAVGSAYEARLDLKRLVSQVGIPEPTRTLERFGNEYLLRTSDDGRYVEGFHAIRSEIIAAELTDDILQPRGDVEAIVVPLLAEDDLESFLLCSFSRNAASADKVVNTLHAIALNTWVGVRGVCAALQWLGLREYANVNAELVNNVRVIFGGGWWFTLDWDLAQVCGKSGFGVLDSLRHISQGAEFAANAAATVRRQQSDKTEVFSYAAQWLSTFNIPASSPNSVDDFISIAEVLYWMGHLQLANNAVSEWLHEDVISQAWAVLPIHLFAEFAFAIRHFSPAKYECWLNDHRDTVKTQLRQRSSILALVEENDCLVAHFAVNIDKTASKLKPADSEANVNDLAVERVEIVSRCLPGFKKYGASGYGHQMTLFSGMGDDSTKRMPVENITIPWLPEFNALARGVVELRFRPGSWNEYYTQIRSMREKVIAAFHDLRAAAKSVDTKGAAALRDTRSWDECKRLVNADCFLPRIAVDEWGFVTESRAARYINHSKAKKFSAISTLDPFNKAVNEYTRTVGDFMEQSIQALVLVPNLRSVTTAAARTSVIAKANELKIPENSIRLSVLNGMNACVAVRDLHRVEHLLADVIGMNGVDESFRTNELNEFAETMRNWAVFCYPSQIMSKPKQTTKGKRPKSRQRVELKDSLTSTRHRINSALKKLKVEGIYAGILTDTIPWDQDTALWIIFDTPHPLGSIVALERLWFTLVEAFTPDYDKIVRVKAIDWLWRKIVLVPLVRGRSLEKQAFANMSGVVCPLDKNPASQLWRFMPEPIPSEAWSKLGCEHWERQPSWDVFDRFAAAYGGLFCHIDHIADFTRCSVQLDELGTSILQDYLRIEQERMQPFLQETFDSCASLLRECPKLDESVVVERPNILNCMNLILGMKDSIYPVTDFEQKAQLTLDEMAEWRNRLRTGFDLVGEARCLWVADSLRLDGFARANTN